MTRPIQILLRLEGLALLTAALWGYAALGGGWIVFASALLLPDLAMIAYLRGPKIGAATYNAAHTTSLPAVLLAVGLLTDTALATDAALIWIAHIGMDRALGYGLKRQAGFRSTHLTTTP
ncbi:DUF4260 domain-containing protein [uncultured Jannaschia sp.]|uniref:DUF4260 domain-containing protein n=1 Tax=uncultured Jannaschia sp. TaxID=293347 RepID=UPI0026391519|nr:DUF4260 domain-containing protein [uncultured Jannaschia sp.]